MKETKEKAITLVALVITIIILLILVGITISTLNGENGLFTKAKLAKQKYEINEVKEKIEMEIMTLRIEQEGKGESLTKEDLPKINSDEIDVRSIESFPVEVISNGYKFNIDENFKVTYVGEANETVVTYTTNPEGYTNKDKVSILLKISSPIGIKRVEYPKGEEPLIANGEKEFGLDYEVTENGTYTFKVIDNNDNEVTKDVVIDKIDKLSPLDFTPKCEDVGTNGFTIEANARDAEPDEMSTKSGIEKYEYYVKISTDIEYIKYESTETNFTVTGLEPSTEYNIYVIAYDKADNSKESNSITVVTSVGPKDIYIDSINGNNSTGKGTKEKPYKTLEKVTETGLIKQNVIYNIYLQDGIYDFPDMYQMIELNCNQSINIYGNKQNTILKLPNKGIGADSSTKYGKDYNLNFYRLVMELNETTRSNYWSCINSITLKNIVLKIDAEPTFSFICNYPTSSVNFNNCISINKSIRMRCDAERTQRLTNCYGAYTSGYGTNETQWNYQTNYITKTPQVDPTTYRIIDDESVWKNVGTGTNPDGTQANLGVYGGEYSWEN